MTSALLTIGRAMAYAEGRAIPIRSAFDIAPDPLATFGIALLRLATEEFVQAVAYGELGGTPEVVVRWNPLSMDVSDLEPFAAALVDYVDTMRRCEQPCRFWLGHKAALKTLDVLGARYHRNRNASPIIRRMGEICLAIVREARYPGQQIVVVETEVFRRHVVTGQAPVKDLHLGSLLAWVEPDPGKDPAEVADQRALVPISALLPAEVDKRVERLRNEAKGKKGKRDPIAADAARREIEGLLRKWVLVEWGWLVQGRRAFWDLGLLPMDADSPLVKESLGRTSFSFGIDLNSPNKPHSLARQLDDFEFNTELVETQAVDDDAVAREIAARKGKVLRATIHSVDQPSRGRKPCVLTLSVAQNVLRIRRGTSLRLLDSNVQGTVLDVDWDEATGETLIVVDLVNGVRSRPNPGASTEWSDSVPMDLRFKKKRTYDVLQSAAPPLVYGTGLPPARPRVLPPDDLTDVAAALKRR